MHRTLLHRLLKVQKKTSWNKEYGNMDKFVPMDIQKWLIGIHQIKFELK